MVLAARKSNFEPLAIIVLLTGIIGLAFPTQSESHDFKKGDSVFPAEGLELRVGDDVVGGIKEAYGPNFFDLLDPPAYLEVVRIHGDWLQVASDSTHSFVAGWVHASHLIPASRAVDYWNQKLAERPSAERHLMRGMAILNRAASPQAKNLTVEAREAAIKADMGRYAADLQAAVRLDPANAWAHFLFAEMLNFTRMLAAEAEVPEVQVQHMEDMEKALLEKSVELDPAFPWSRIHLSQLLYGDKRAVQLARQGCELTGWKNLYALGVLAGAYERVGDFDNAAQVQRSACELSGWQDSYELKQLAKVLERSGDAEGAARVQERVADTKTVIKQLRSIHSRLNKYYLSKEQFPDSAEGLTALQRGDSGATFSKEKLPANDPWGNHYKYELLGPVEYRIWSLGADGKDSTNDEIALRAKGFSKVRTGQAQPLPPPR